MKLLLPLTRIYAQAMNAGNNITIREHQERIDYAKQGIEYRRAVAGPYVVIGPIKRPVSDEIAKKIIDQSQAIVDKLETKNKKRSQRCGLTI